MVKQVIHMLDLKGKALFIQTYTLSLALAHFVGTTFVTVARPKHCNLKCNRLFNIHTMYFHLHMCFYGLFALSSWARSFSFELCLIIS